MKCPHCGYEHGWSNEKMDRIEGEKGSFFVHPVKMEQKDRYEEAEAALYACPECNKTFINRY
jgi:predicted RNA-binding Zn-ribbon protein involved in translation (DUF1610 family)